MDKARLSNFIRQLGLIYQADRIRFVWARLKNRKKNRLFRNQHPDVVLPPDYLMYESFRLDYFKYYVDGVNTAKWLVGLISNHAELRNKKILDWGCGPGRIIRHLPEIVNNECTFYGTDYNEHSIRWCTENLQGITFSVNKLEAKLPYDSGYFDVLYGISIFTHLSEAMHYDWYAELFRVVAPGGIMVFTTQGDNFRMKLSPPELADFEAGELVVRGKVKEGHRTYSAFHPDVFLRNLFEGAEILEHITRKPESSKYIPQDVWILKKG